MATAASRKSVMTLFCSPTCVYSHRTRIVLHEKGISADVEYVDMGDPPEDLVELNPYGTMPTLVDRDLVLYDSRIIMEYLDERFPHPPLHPMDPVSRARARLLVHRVEQDWYGLVEEIENASDAGAQKARKQLRESLLAATPVFAAKPYFLSDEFCLVDCSLAPLLWRLPMLGIELPRQAEPVKAYAARLFERHSFQASLSDEEREFGAAARLTPENA
ncbi:glutathione S-transferase N-terminal domain-containing protein [Methylococcus capsulatus]|uniref:Stringent starvation protein A n=2 Tax=Methylococcus capsulatus TaxID=414 RepID=A0AA35Y1Q7_METCP|nr:glutathione S-transferase N-terminal domain-containing protein [Methylococcus capsulatus]QXP87415.1 stringent starvation protein A [Methylococcus capsulatus]QXP91231.1 stringent starvation protein A [Methylococcus capsulatus]QXP92844.1 stringent starvation protein A [Methylococcus capsulatus]UQN12418.1 stringent starvation protein A [Methylococcus capsulatus]CAI8859613.1 stringent starvation protein A [Methylococcus capsulatus]